MQSPLADRFEVLAQTMDTFIKGTDIDQKTDAVVDAITVISDFFDLYARSQKIDLSKATLSHELGAIYSPWSILRRKIENHERLVPADFRAIREQILIPAARYARAEAKRIRENPEPELSLFD